MTTQIYVTITKDTEKLSKGCQRNDKYKYKLTNKYNANDETKINFHSSTTHSSYRSIKRICGGAGLILLGN